MIPSPSPIEMAWQQIKQWCREGNVTPEDVMQTGLPGYIPSPGEMAYREVYRWRDVAVWLAEWEIYRRAAGLPGSP